MNDHPTSALATALLVALGGGLGAPARYLIDQKVQSWHHGRIGWGTFTVNVIGSLLLGALAGSAQVAVQPWIFTLCGTGVCGALTTFSTLGLETLRLIEAGAWREAGMSAVVGSLIGLAACSAGFAISAQLG